MTVGDVMRNGHNRRYYENRNKKTFFVHFDRATIIASPLTIVFLYEETLRYYAKPELAAAVIGVLIQLGNTGFTSTGFSYRNSSCYPSVSHVNGEAIDIKYSGNYKLSGASQPNEIANDVNVIRWLYKFGFRKTIIGNNNYHNSIYSNLPTANRVDMIEGRNNAHDNHIHSYHFEIRKTPIIYGNNN